MDTIEFPESNIAIAENQPEYNTVHALHDGVEGSIIMCFKLSEDERNRMYATGEIWIKQLTFNQPMQPLGCSTLKEDYIKP